MFVLRMDIGQLELKKSMEEKETGPRIKEIDLYIDTVVSKVEKYLEKPTKKRLSDWDELNGIFLRLLEEKKQVISQSS